ncbi:DUF1501 domain-containing protein [Prosthecobacter sp.]|uniref:DUF1501 domain-containing protein n=1 Tax=Prosthecobacter sp. TaxID=1965333 RepID=UPI003783E781
MNSPFHESLKAQTRRHFLGSTGQFSLGALALQALELGAAKATAETSSGAHPPHQPAKARRVIYLHMSGGPPNLDIFDYKPELVKRSGQPCPDSFLKGRQFAFTSGVPSLLGTPRTFSQHGSAGMWMSDAVPHFHSIADDITLVRSMHTDQFNHAPAELLLFTGHARQGRPSMGSWATYGLGTENQDLPAFVALISSGTQPSGGQNLWGSGFMPSVFQGVQCRGKGDPVLFAGNPSGITSALRRSQLNAMEEINHRQWERQRHPETLTRIAQYELAYRMQTSVPEVMDISKEPRSMLDAYGARPGESSFANNCLLARRLVENGVRFVHLFDWGWDFHGTNPREDIRAGLSTKMAATDKPAAALIRDLKQRGLLEDTLVVLGGEFGRTPFREGRTAKSPVLGRDHYPDCFSLMLAGGGVKSGFDYGSTDELGFSGVENKVHIHDLQATIMHLLGLDHERLIYRFQGRDYRLTDVHGHVVKDILA